MTSEETIPQLPPLSEIPPSPPLPQVDVWREIYADIAKGDPHALDMLVSWANFCHAIDDCVDRDKDVDPERLVNVYLSWSITVGRNPFFQNNQGGIYAAVIMSANAFLDSVEWENSENLKKRNFADAWRSFFSQFVFYVAFLQGGFQHMREMSKKYRELIFDCQHEEEVEDDGIRPSPYAPTLPKGINQQGSKKPLKAPFQPRTVEDWGRLTTFAASFHHEIDKRFAYLILADDDDKWIGFAKMISVPPPGATGLPLFCTAWHPDTLDRQIHEGVQMLTNWAKIQFGGMGTIIPKDSPMKKAMEKWGYECSDLVYWETRR